MRNFVANCTFLTAAAVFKVLPSLMHICYVKSINTLPIHMPRIHGSSATKFSAMTASKEFVKPTGAYQLLQDMLWGSDTFQLKALYLWSDLFVKSIGNEL